MSPTLKTAITFFITLGFVCMVAYFAQSKKTSEKITLHGASLFDGTHSYTKALVRFQELVTKYYQGPVELEFVLHDNGELGTEKDFFGYMNIGAVVDYAVVAPSHVSKFSSMATIMDIPFLFRDVDHYIKSINHDVFAPVKDDIYERADVLILGYGGGEQRHIFGRRPVRDVEELKGFSMRVMGAPIQSRMFSELGATPTVISTDEIYNAIQTGVIEGAENSIAVIELLKWYEVAKEVSITSVSYIVRPLFFNGKRLKSFPEDLQAAILKAGEEAMRYEQLIEISQDDTIMKRLVSEGKVKTHQFTERNKLLEMAAPVKENFAQKIGASDILDEINAIP